MLLWYTLFQAMSCPPIRMSVLPQFHYAQMCCQAILNRVSVAILLLQQTPMLVMWEIIQLLGVHSFCQARSCPSIRMRVFL